MSPDELNQDLLTIILPSGYCIYVGWFPEYSTTGEFWVCAAWENGEIPPIKAKSIGEVQEKVKELVKIYSAPQISHTASSACIVEFSG